MAEGEGSRLSADTQLERNDNVVDVLLHELIVVVSAFHANRPVAGCNITALRGGRVEEALHRLLARGSVLDSGERTVLVRQATSGNKVLAVAVREVCQVGVRVACEGNREEKREYDKSPLHLGLVG